MRRPARSARNRPRFRRPTLRLDGLRRFSGRSHGGPSRVRFPSLGAGGQRRLPYGMTPDIVRGLVTLVAPVVLAALGGLAIGTALAKISGNDDSAGAGAATTVTTAATPTTPTTTPATPATSTIPGAPQPDRPPADVRVWIVSASLRLAGTESGKRRKRARLSVRVRVTNRGTQRFVPSRPVLVSGDDRVKTDPDQDAEDTNLGALVAGATGAVTLRFETAGAVTTRLRKDLRARLTVAGKTKTATVKLAGTVGSPG